ncbi:MAG: threonine--tRNA ligase [Candidatus Wildermuthbacteria bacterium RIFCSPHIGHO2_12_FULL_40_12]|uniref:Threonine--tRNA ligase n=1 Tax=Candidatus Wildermuthbacteria bacterium RIFCSPHIGHO2_12_FULL_40_12 TaxID=1802457 RepID=A0A1G2REY9_9BACT|nr:MAG: threonine--tRNA ligase [Candidatus Wildermuthbacteria bacterium RIFCSPHIGHO2_12_FULL_40_12]
MKKTKKDVANDVEKERPEQQDHKALGAKLDLFTFSDLVGPGLPLWTPKGTLIRHLLDDFVWELRQKRGYSKVEIPHITKKDLYIKSGHWDKFKDELFQIKTREGHIFALKPMNCPHHTQIFARKIHSYKELPQRYANTTMMYRDEQTGELSGILRVRAISIDDSHIFARRSQVKEEIINAWDIIQEFYNSFGFKLQASLSLRDPKRPEKYLGNPSVWQETEQILREVAKHKATKTKEDIGEAAFYGPKIDFISQDSLGRKWQMATIQLDMNMPERFNLYCINEKGQEERIVMIHYAVMGSLERFLANLLEHFAGALPLWLSPEQIWIIPITSKQTQYAKEIAKMFQVAGFRFQVRDENETLSKRIREGETQKIPYLLVIGEKEEKSKNISVRRRGKDMGSMRLDKFLKQTIDEISKKDWE